ncbi:Calcium uniporter protein_ mitochondriallike, partial [Caligus rogercresseyi]
RGDFLSMIQEEDKGVDRAVIRSSTSGTLLTQDFTLSINDKDYAVSPTESSELLVSERPLSESDLALFGD